MKFYVAKEKYNGYINDLSKNTKHKEINNYLELMNEMLNNNKKTADRIK